MDNRRIIFTTPGNVELLTESVREPADGEVLVELSVSTISSGTERANLAGEINVTPFRECKEAVFPRSSGYSAVGKIIQTGKNVRSLCVGDRVALIWSKHSQYLCMKEANVVKIEDDSITDSEAALCHIGAFPLAAIRKCRLEIGEAALIMGLGILGMMAVNQLRAAGAAPVIAADPVESRRKRALELGADYAFDPLSSDFAQQVKAVSDGGVNVAIEVTGVGGGLNNALDCMKRFGRIALLGCTRHSDFTVDYYRKVHGPGISLIGAHTQARTEHDSFSGMWTTADDIRAQLRLLSMNRLSYKELVEEIHSPKECKAVYQRLLTEKSFPIVQFDWGNME